MIGVVFWICVALGCVIVAREHFDHSRHGRAAAWWAGACFAFGVVIMSGLSI